MGFLAVEIKQRTKQEKKIPHIAYILMGEGRKERKKKDKCNMCYGENEAKVEEDRVCLGKK